MTNKIVPKSTILEHSRWLRLAHTLWYPAAAVAFGICIASIPGYMVMLQEGGPGFDLIADPSSLKIVLNTANVVVAISTALLSLTLAWVLYRKKSGERMVVFLSFFLLLFGVGLGPLATLAQSWTEYPAFGFPMLETLLFAPPFLALLFVFPDGRFVPSWSRWLVILSIPIILVGYALEALIEEFYTRPLGEISSFWSLAFGLTALLAQVYRYRVVSSPDERQQTKWVVFGFSLMFTFIGVSSIAYPKMLQLAPGSPFPWYVPVAVLLYTISFTFLPLSLTGAVLRYRLYDIDIIINRTLVYGALTAIVVGLYMLAVGAASIVFQSNNNLAGALLATVVVIVSFKPLRTTLQRAVDHLMSSGDREARLMAPINLAEDAQVDQVGFASAPLSGRWLGLLRAAWVVLAIVALGIFIASLPGYSYGLSSGFGFIEVLPLLGPSNLNFALSLAFVVASISTVLLSLTLAWVLYRQKPGERMAVILSFYLLYYGVVETLADPLPELSSSLITIIVSLFVPLLIAIILLFPDGRFVPSWTRWLVILSIPMIPLGYVFETSTASVLASPLGWMGMFLGLGVGIAALFSQIYRYRVVSSPIERQQTKWVVYGLSLMFLSTAISFVPYVQIKLLPPGSPVPGWFPVSPLMWSISLIFLPLSLTIAVMRYRLYDIDIIINRTLVYGALTASTMGIYVLIVGYLGNIIQAQDKTFFAFLSTGLVALLFQPLRERLQSIVNRLMYGESTDPASVLSRLGKQLEETVTPHAALSGIVESLAQALKLPYAAVEFGMGDDAQTVTSFGQPPDKVFRFPIVYQAENIGCLVAAPRSPNESFRGIDETLLENIAQQAGAVSHAARLTVDLQRFRERLVSTREEERRRLRRDLHDGIGPTMASQTLKLDAALDLIAGDPDAGQEQDLEEAIKILMELKEQTQGSVTNIRRIVYALRPPALDDLGLVPAIQTHVAQQTRSLKNLNVSVETPAQSLPPLSAAVELATYRITLEALTNVIHHARARNCTISLSVSAGRHRRLNLEIVDDGGGLSENHQAGVGLTSMRERAEELGGAITIESALSKGTRILAQIPILPVEK